MADVKKKNNLKRRWNFWRSYSFILTVFFLFSVSFIAVSAADSDSVVSDEILDGQVEVLDAARASGQKYTYYNGILYRYSGISWKPVTWTANGGAPGSADTAHPVSDFQAMWQNFAEESGIALASSGGGGMTLSEFSSFFNSWYASATNTISGFFGTTLVADPSLGQYLDYDGNFHPAPSSGGGKNYNLATLVANGLMGLSTNIKSIQTDSSTNFTALQKILSDFRTEVHSDSGLLNTSITDGFSVNHTDLSSFKQEAHTDSLTVNSSINSGFSTNHTDLRATIAALIGSDGSVSGSFPIWGQGNATSSADNLGDVLAGGFMGLGMNQNSMIDKLMGASGSVSGVAAVWSPVDGPVSVPASADNIGDAIVLTAQAVTMNQSILSQSFLDGVTDWDQFWNSSTGEVYGTSAYRSFTQRLFDWATPVQNDLAKLRYVLASDKDIEIAETQAPVKDAVADSFTGSSSAAVKDTDVGDMAGFSGSLQESFSTGANASDAFGFLNGSDSWGFFSERTAQDLHQVPSTTSDENSVLYSDIENWDDLEGIDFIRFYDPSGLDSYLSGGD